MTQFGSKHEETEPVIVLRYAEADIRHVVISGVELATNDLSRVPGSGSCGEARNCRCNYYQ